MLRDNAAESSELQKEWEGVESSSKHLCPDPSTMTRDKLLGTEPAPTNRDAQTQRQAADQESPGF